MYEAVRFLLPKQNFSRHFHSKHNKLFLSVTDFLGPVEGKSVPVRRVTLLAEPRFFFKYKWLATFCRKSVRKVGSPLVARVSE